MTTAVELDQVRAQIARYGPHPFLVSVTPEGAPHTVSAAVQWTGDELVVDPGDRTRAAVVEHPAVTLLWPPPEPGGYSLIVDGTAAGDDDAVRIRITSAVLHLTQGGATDSPTCVRLYRDA